MDLVAGGGSDVAGRGRRPGNTLSRVRWESQLCDTSRTGLVLLEGSADREAGEQGRSRMASNGIRDRVAIVGMGCTPFGEHWDKGVSDLLVDATKEALGSAGIELPHVDERSEEHTSELQSRQYLVCRLLLEKQNR